MARGKRKMPTFGDREAIAELRTQSSDEELDERRKREGKVFSVQVKYTITEEREKTLEVIALDDNDAEEVACNELLETEGEADEDSLEASIISVREYGKGRDDKNTLEMFPNQVLECGKS